MDYQQVLRNLEELLWLVKSQLVEEDIVPKTKAYVEEEKKRHKFKMNQTFNITQTSMVEY